MPDRSADWLRQAEVDLEQAGASQEAGRFEWACFASHQAAEKAVKALHLSLGQQVIGHAIRELLTLLPESVDVPTGFADLAKSLDLLYVPTRYPNGHPAGAPCDNYGRPQSEQAIDYARQIVEFSRDAMARP